MTFLGSLRVTKEGRIIGRTLLVTRVSEPDRIGRYTYGIEIYCQTPRGTKSRLEISSEVLTEMIKCHAKECPNATVWLEVADIRRERKRRGW